MDGKVDEKPRSTPSKYPPCLVLHSHLRVVRQSTRHSGFQVCVSDACNQNRHSWSVEEPATLPQMPHHLGLVSELFCRKSVHTPAEKNCLALLEQPGREEEREVGGRGVPSPSPLTCFTRKTLIALSPRPLTPKALILKPVLGDRQPLYV